MDVAADQTLNPLDAGWQALAEGAWEDARVNFSAALQQEETAEGLEGLGWAAWWLNDITETFRSRELAYRRYHKRGDLRGAARVAICLSGDHFSRRGEYAVANGWAQRAGRLLDGLEPVPEHAMLGAWEAHMALWAHYDTADARRLGAEAMMLARSLGAVDLEMLAQALLGYVMVCEGAVQDGMRLVDEATMAAVAGDMTNLDAIATTCCYLIYACERVRDYPRAAQWCDRVMRITERWSHRLMFSVCRTHYAGVLMWRGAWSEAEAELTAATDELTATHPAMAVEGLVRLAELRRCQGRLEEAAVLLEKLDDHPVRIFGSKPALLGRATLALDQDDAASAADLAERFLRAVMPENLMDRVPGLEVLVRAQAALGNHGQAAETLRTLVAITSTIGTPPLRAASNFCKGVVAVASGDYAEARRRFEDAVDLFDQSAAPYEAARSRLELGNALAALGRLEAAAREARAAFTALEKIGAACETTRAAALLRRVEKASPEHAAGETAGTTLTSRELQILRLVAQGLSDKEAAAALDLSEHTVHRHISNILNKLDVPSRTAAVAQAARYGVL
jgi:LuxR family transcriptional regulator, maltose regulon positive regulatory protein